MIKAAMVVMRKDGRLHLAQEVSGPADAQRWADEGYQVFLIGVGINQWVVNHVSSGRVMSSASEDGPQTYNAGEAADALKLLPIRRG